MSGDHVFDQRVGGPIESPRGHLPDRAEQLVDRNAQPGRQFMQRAGMRMVPGADHAANRPLVELAGTDHVLKRQPVAGHQAAEIRGDRRPIAVTHAGGNGNHASRTFTGF